MIFFYKNLNPFRTAYSDEHIRAELKTLSGSRTMGELIITARGGPTLTTGILQSTGTSVMLPLGF